MSMGPRHAPVQVMVQDGDGTAASWSSETEQEQSAPILSANPMGTIVIQQELVA